MVGCVTTHQTSRPADHVITAQVRSTEDSYEYHVLRTAQPTEPQRLQRPHPPSSLTSRRFVRVTSNQKFLEILDRGFWRPPALPLANADICSSVHSAYGYCMYIQSMYGWVYPFVLRSSSSYVPRNAGGEAASELSRPGEVFWNELRVWCVSWAPLPPARAWESECIANANASSGLPPSTARHTTF